MADILHRVGIRHAEPKEVYDALTTIEGLSGWWTEETTGNAQTGGKIEFRFHGGGGCEVDVVEARPSERVVWRVTDGPAEWVGTTLEWTLRPGEEHTIVLFAHAGWREPVEFMHHCSTKWGTFLLSLKSLVEDGAGRPAPHDPPLGDWR